MKHGGGGFSGRLPPRSPSTAPRAARGAPPPFSGTKAAARTAGQGKAGMGLRLTDLAAADRTDPNVTASGEQLLTHVDGLVGRSCLLEVCRRAPYKLAQWPQCLVSRRQLLGEQPPMQLGPKIAAGDGSGNGGDGDGGVSSEVERGQHSAEKVRLGAFEEPLSTWRFETASEGRSGGGRSGSARLLLCVHDGSATLPPLYLTGTLQLSEERRLAAQWRVSRYEPSAAAFRGRSAEGHGVHGAHCVAVQLWLHEDAYADSDDDYAAAETSAAAAAAAAAVAAAAGGDEGEQTWRRPPPQPPQPLQPDKLLCADERDGTVLLLHRDDADLRLSDRVGPAGPRNSTAGSWQGGNMGDGGGDGAPLEGDGFVYSIAWEVDPDDVQVAEHLSPDLYCAPCRHAAHGIPQTSAHQEQQQQQRRPFFDYFEQ